MPTRVQALTDFPVVAWRNGLGGTRVIASASSAGTPAWRVSIATIRGDAPFSVLPGIDRVLLPLVPGSVSLTADGVPLPVSADGAIRFDGSLEVRAVANEYENDGQERHVLNIMTPSKAAITDDRVELRHLLVSGPYASNHPRTVCDVVRTGEIVTGDRRLIRAPAVIPPHYYVDARAAFLVEVVLTASVSTET